MPIGVKCDSQAIFPMQFLQESHKGMLKKRVVILLIPDQVTKHLNIVETKVYHSAAFIYIASVVRAA